MNRFLILIIGLTFIWNPVFSQEQNNSNHFSIKIKEKESKNKKKINLNKFSLKKMFVNTDLNVLVGATQFYGDIKQWDHIPAYESSNNFFEMKEAIEISFNKQINRLFSVQTSAVTGRFGGLRREKLGIPNEIFDPYDFYEGTGEYFICNFKEFDLQLLINVSNIMDFFIMGGSRDKFQIYYKNGIGYNIFNTVNRNLESGHYIYSYGYTDEVQDIGGRIKKSLLNQPKETVYIYGLVIDYELTEKFSLLFDVTKRRGKTDKWDASISDFNNVVASEYDNFNFYSFGVSYNIGGRSEEKEWISPLEGLQKEINSTTANIEWISEDADHDGVSDAFDKELNTPMGVAVDGSGVALDIDMDNVPDYKDEDPFSSRGAIVDNNGVEFDSDNDGIPDSKDLENNTKIGSIVNQYGISVSQISASGDNISYFPSIYFESGSSYINTSNLKRIATIAMVMNNNPNIRLEVTGNTDKNGTMKHNQQLAQKRAESVIDYLSSNFGIDKNRFEAKSNGETKPLSNEVNSQEFPNSNTLSEINRRVDFQIIP